MRFGAKTGYSLFEVLVAFAIMTMVMSVLLPGQTRLLQKVGSVDEKVLALDYAISRANLASVTPTTEWTQTEVAYRDWVVTQTILDEDDNVRRLVIRVVHREGSELASIETFGVVE